MSGVEAHWRAVYPSWTKVPFVMEDSQEEERIRSTFPQWTLGARIKPEARCCSCRKWMRVFDIHAKCKNCRRKPEVRACDGQEVNCKECRAWPQVQKDALQHALANSLKRAKGKVYIPKSKKKSLSLAEATFNIPKRSTDSSIEGSATLKTVCTRPEPREIQEPLGPVTEAVPTILTQPSDKPRPKATSRVVHRSAVSDIQKERKSKLAYMFQKDWSKWTPQQHSTLSPKTSESGVVIQSSDSLVSSLCSDTAMPEAMSVATKAELKASPQEGLQMISPSLVTQKEDAQTLDKNIPTSQASTEETMKQTLSLISKDNP